MLNKSTVSPSLIPPFQFHRPYPCNRRPFTPRSISHPKPPFSGPTTLPRLLPSSVLKTSPQAAARPYPERPDPHSPSPTSPPQHAQPWRTHCMRTSPQRKGTSPYCPHTDMSSSRSPAPSPSTSRSPPDSPPLLLLRKKKTTRISQTSNPPAASPRRGCRGPACPTACKKPRRAGP